MGSDVDLPSRRRFLGALAALAAAGPLRALAAPGGRPAPRKAMTNQQPAPARQPALFVGHGSPMNAIEENQWSRGFRALAALLPVPKAVLAVSAHWFVPGLHVTGEDRPETIHDFGGFPRELYQVQYPAPGAPELARRVVALLGDRRASVRTDWGLDHGTWSVLVHLRPAADVPVVQLSLDARLAPAEHLALARALAPLRDEGVLILASGNVTHNLRAAFGAFHAGDLTTPAWASTFDAEVARAAEQRDGAWLARALGTDAGRRSHPTPDHFLPVLYAVGAAGASEPVRFPVTGFDMASLSMRAILYG
jgi:4,5-DOPA dioxygenase extradiol